MRPSVHAIASISGGIILWQGCHSWQAGLISVLAGFFIDLDHFFDYIIAGERSWKIKDFLHFYHTFKEPHIYVPLHAWELVPILGALAWAGFWPAWLGGTAFGMGHHLLLDQIGNGFKWNGYILTHRLLSGFKSESITKG